MQAAILAGVEPVEGADVDTMIGLARRIHALGPAWVLVKGGHLPGVHLPVGHGGAAGPERAGRQRGTGAAGSLWGGWPGWGRTGQDRVEEGTGPSRTARKGGEAEASSRTGPGGPGGAKEMAGGGREGGAWGIPGAALSLGRRLLDALPDD